MAKAPSFAQEMRAQIKAAGFTQFEVAHHDGRPPRWFAYGYAPDGRHRHVTFNGPQDWRAALDTLVNQEAAR
jgi:hypothetical protein